LGSAGEEGAVGASVIAATRSCTSSAVALAFSARPAARSACSAALIAAAPTVTTAASEARAIVNASSTRRSSSPIRGGRECSGSSQSSVLSPGAAVIHSSYGGARETPPVRLIRPETT